MKPRMTRLWGWLVMSLLGVAGAPSGWACATCFGRSDSGLAEGMNMGILFLLGVILSVLATLAGFFVFLARRAAAVRAAIPESPPSV
ncbi:MAG: hypothetical protein HS113_23280 [Verrucomicrobiales bacterium]|nr:hypothetical protein [Verrucomicrobiales bacterium]